MIFLALYHIRATVIEENFDEVYTAMLYKEFGINATPVIYNTSGNSACIYYAQPEVNTITAIQDFNNDTGENISLYGVINCPEQCADSIMEYYGIIEDEDKEND